MPIDFQEDKGIDFVPDEVAPPKLIDPSTVKLSPSELAKMEPGYRPMGIFGPLEPQELLELPKVAQIPGAVLEPLATAAEDMAADWYRRTGIDPSAEPGKSPITMESYPVTAGGPLGLALRQIAPKTAADIDKGAADIIKGFTTPGQQLMLPAAGLSKPLGTAYGLSMIGDVPEAVKQIAEEGAVGIPRLAVDIGGGAGFIKGIPERAAAPIPQRAVVPPPVPIPPPITGRALKMPEGGKPLTELEIARRDYQKELELARRQHAKTVAEIRGEMEVEKVKIAKGAEPPSVAPINIETVDAVRMATEKYGEDALRKGFENYLRNFGDKPPSDSVRAIHFAQFAKGLLSGEEKSTAAIKESTISTPEPAKPPPVVQGKAEPVIPGDWKLKEVSFSPSENHYQIKDLDTPKAGVSFIDPETKTVYFGTTHGEIWDAVRINEKRRLVADNSLNGFFTGSKFVDRNPDKNTVTLSTLEPKPPLIEKGVTEPSPVPPAAPTSEVTAKEAAPTVPEPAISKTTPVGEKWQEGTVDFTNDVKKGDVITFEPNENRRKQYGEIPVQGIVQDVIHNQEGGIGFHIFSPHEGDPNNVVRVWADRGKVISRKPAAVEEKLQGIRSTETVGEVGNPRRPKTVVEIADEIAAQGVDPQASYGMFVKARDLKPEINAAEWLPIYRKSLELAKLDKQIAVTKKQPPTPPLAPVKEPWEMTRSEFEKEFNDLTAKVSSAEKTPQRRMSPEEIALMRKDWKAYSKSRGYSEQEIADFERLQNLSLPLSDLIPKGEEIPLVSPENIHATFVARAIREGKKVPKNVLNEYPELTKGEKATQGKVQSTARRFRPREQVVFEKPLVGPSGAKLVAYEWRWQPEEFVDKYGEEKTRRVSNWEEAESSGDTGRDIVHQFLVEMPNGDRRLVSAESVPVLLGFAERGKGSRLPSLVSATKTLAQLRMKLATVKAQLDEYNKAVESANKLPLPEITSEPAIAAVGIDKGKRWGTEWKMGDASVMQHDELPISPERKATLESFWRANRVAETGAKQPYASVRDLQNRIERQQRKIKDITGTAAVVVPSPTPIPEGPGAATVGDVPKAPQIVQLTEEFKRIEGKPVSFRDKLREWFNVAEHKSLAQGAFQRSLDALKSTRDYLINKWDGVKDFDDIKRVKGELSAEINSRGWTLRQFENQTRKSIPRKADREAISSWLDNGGDEAKIRKAMAEAPERYKKSYEDALNLSPELKLAAEHIRSFFESRLQEAIDAGVLEEGITDYIHRIYKRDTPVKERILNQVQSGVLNTKTPGLAMKRAFEFDYEAEKAGYPIVKDFLPRIVDYEYSLARVIADRSAVKKFMDIRMSDGRPMIDVAGIGIPIESAEGIPEGTLIKPQVKPGDPTNPGSKGYRKDYLERNDYPAFRKWKWATKDPETGRSIFVQGDVLVHPEAAERIDALMAKSAIRRTKLGSAALGLSSTFKQTMLDFSGFHQVQIAVHGLEHRVTPWNLIKDIDVTNPKVQGLLKGGLNIGGDFHAFDYREGLVGRSLSRMIPGLGELMQSYHEYLFRDYIPRVKTTMALHALERNRQRFPRMTEEQLNYLTAKQANAAFGELNYILMERSKTAQDISRLILLAPDFLEARGSFAAQAFQRAGLKDLRPDKFLSGNEQRQALLLGALTLYVTARIANKLIDDQYHFEPENAFSIVHGGHSYSLRTVQGDLLHLWDKPFQFWLNRLNPVFGRTFLELGTGRDYFGRKRSRMELAWDLLANIRPIAFRDSQERKLWESALNAFGVQAKRWTDVDDAFTLAKKWKDEHGIGERGEFIYDAEKDPLRQLKLALNHGDEAEAAKQIGQIIKPGSYYTKDKLKNYFDRYASMPFTGSIANDKKWKATLSEDQLKTVESAKEHKRQIRQLFLKSYSQYNAALAAQPYATRTGKQ